jgi:chromosome segregation ATPase
LLIIVAVATAFAQDAATLEQQTERLRAQIREISDKQAQLQAREQQLDEDLKPENLQRSIAGVGTTDAEALRDRRREQLEREKASVEEQLRTLDTSRTRLEAAIASAEAEAVRLRAVALNENNAPAQAAEAGNTNAAPVAREKGSTRRASKRPVRRRRQRRRASSPR